MTQLKKEDFEILALANFLPMFHWNKKVMIYKLHLHFLIQHTLLVLLLFLVVL